MDKNKESKVTNIIKKLTDGGKSLYPGYIDVAVLNDAMIIVKVDDEGKLYADIVGSTPKYFKETLEITEEDDGKEGIVEIERDVEDAVLN